MNSRSQLSEIFIRIRHFRRRFLIQLELFQEAEVITIEEADIVNAVSEQGNTFHPHTEGEPGINLRVVIYPS